jgi:hypothetical protein
MLVNGPSDVPQGAPSDAPREDEKRHHDAVLKWAEQALNEGEAFLKSQVGYSDFDTTVNMIMGDDKSGDARPSILSSLTTNQFGKIALDLKSAELDIKPFFDFKTSNPSYEQQSVMAQKLAKAWWTRRHIPMRLNDVLSYANAMGTGPTHHFWDTRIEDQNISAEDPRDLIPIRPGSFQSYQECFGLILRKERSVNYIKAMYPYTSRGVRPDRDSSLLAQAANNRVSNLLSSMGMQSGFMQNLYASLGGKPKAQSMNIPTADLFTCYIDDRSVNKSGHTITMGLTYDHETGKKTQRTNWSYDVLPGERLYPRKRCIIFTRSTVLYDDTSIYWHGLFPFTKLTIDPWPWSWMGKAPMRDLIPLQRELTKMCRGVSQHWDKVFRPGVIADKNAVGRAALERFDTQRAGLKLRTNPMAGKGVEIIQEPPLDASAPGWITFLIEQMKELSGSRDASQLTNLGQMPAAETVEKILETMSPSIRLRSQVIESYISEFAMIFLYNAFQFYTKEMRVAVLGKDGMTFEDFDYDPDNMIPDAMTLWPNRDPLLPEQSRADRAQEFARSFTYEVAPGSLLASADASDKLLYMMLGKSGAVDFVTMLEKLGIPNIVSPAVLDQMGHTIMERLQWQSQQGMGMAANSAGRKQTDSAPPRAVIKTS